MSFEYRLHLDAEQHERFLTSLAEAIARHGSFVPRAAEAGELVFDLRRDTPLSGHDWGGDVFLQKEAGASILLVSTLGGRVLGAVLELVDQVAAGIPGLEIEEL